jgi:hypothetical protein
MSNSFKPATRQGVKPLIGLYAESGCGKTYSALLLARGIAGPTGKVGMIDTESGRGSLYADVLPGGYDVLELQEPFSPSSYIDAIQTAEAAGVDVLVIDSMSHEWEGVGGVLDQAGENESRSGKPGLHNWKKPKLEHQKLVLKLLQTRLIIICCVRAKYKSRQVKEGGKTTIVKDDHTSPIQAEDFIFEMTAHAEILPDHTIRLTKCSHPDLRNCFPEDFKAPLSIEHGAAIASWAANPGKVGKPQIAPTTKASSKATLWNLVKSKHADVKAFEQWLWDEGYMDTDRESLSTLSDERLIEITAKIKDAWAKENGVAFL